MTILQYILRLTQIFIGKYNLTMFRLTFYDGQAIRYLFEVFRFFNPFYPIMLAIQTMDNAFHFPSFLSRQILFLIHDIKQRFALEIIILPYYDTISSSSS